MEAVVHVPTHLNDGSEVPLETIQQVRDKAIELFGGYTRKGPFEGGWKSPTGQVFIEPMLVFEFAIDPESVETVREFARWLKLLLDQEAIFVVLRKSDVEFI